MDEQESNAANDEVDVESKRDKRLTDEIDPEQTQRSWKPQAGSGQEQRKRSILPLVTTITVVVAGLAITLALLLLRSPQPTHTTLEKNEDPLALYQVATELYAQGEYNAALQMVERAREVTQHVRARRLLASLKKEIEDAQAGRIRDNDPAKQKALSPHVMGALIGTDDKKNGAKPAAQQSPGQAPPIRGAAARTRRSLVYVESEAVGDILEDGQPTGARTPAQLALPPGRYTIEVVPLLDPSERMSRSVEVPKGRSAHVKMTLPPSPVPASTSGDSAGPPSKQSTTRANDKPPASAGTIRSPRAPTGAASGPEQKNDNTTDGRADSP